MITNRLHRILSYSIAAVWIVNGLLCKLFNLVPRHEQIVARILSQPNSRILTILIGLSEIAMAVWILSRIKARLNVVAQILIVLSMNILEFILVPDLLLWGRFNLLFAFLFIIMVYINEFYLNKESAKR